MPTTPRRPATADDHIQAILAHVAEHPLDAARIMEQVNSTYIASSPTQEDWYWGRLATGNEEDYFWRRLSDNWYQKDVIPSTFLELHNQCYEAYNANPLAFAIIEITTSFVLGKGVRVVGKTPKIQSIIDTFWDDLDNKMEERVYDMCTEIALYGEIYVRFFVNQYDGTVKVRLVDPSIIDQIDCDPDDIEKQLRYHRRPIGPSPTQTMDPVANTLDYGAMGMRGDNSAGSTMNKMDPTMQGEWFEAGKEVVQFAINKVSNAKRGKSDLATLLPWLRRYKDWLTDRVRINKYKGAFLWDVTLRGADAKTIARKKMDYAYPPEPGTVIIHNEAEEWDAVKPDINANDASADGRQIKLMVAVGALLPEHYLSDGSVATRATAAEMGLPTLLKFQRRQKKMRHIIRTILDRVLTEAQNAGKLSRKMDISKAYDLQFPEIDVADNQSMAQAVSYLCQALTVAKAQGWISDEMAMKLIYKCLNEEIDVHEELAKIAELVAAGGPTVPKPVPAPAPVKARTPSPQNAVRESAENPVGTGMMLAFYPDPDVASALAVKGGEPASALHITLAYLGDTEDEAGEGLRPDTSPEKIKAAISLVTSTASPMDGIIGGIGRFTSVPDGAKTPVYASVDATGLAEFRTILVKTVQAAGYFVAGDHDFTAHITLDYLDADAPTPTITLPRNPSLSMRLDTLWLVVGAKRYPFPLTGKGES